MYGLLTPLRCFQSQSQEVNRKEVKKFDRTVSNSWALSGGDFFELQLVDMILCETKITDAAKVLSDESDSLSRLKIRELYSMASKCQVKYYDYGKVKCAQSDI